jgi:acetylornithine/succinyldiaminopimelate/putrescine aminotransferase
VKRIPISAGKLIADKYGYDQVVIIARKVGEGEHCTTYGVNKENCAVAARIGDFLKFKVIGWTNDAALSARQRDTEEK